MPLSMTHLKLFFKRHAYFLLVKNIYSIDEHFLEKCKYIAKKKMLEIKHCDIFRTKILYINIYLTMRRRFEHFNFNICIKNCLLFIFSAYFSLLRDEFRYNIQIS